MRRVGVTAAGQGPWLLQPVEGVQAQMVDAAWAHCLDAQVALSGPVPLLAACALDPALCCTRALIAALGEDTAAS